jgi:hypothetical protein
VETSGDLAESIIASSLLILSFDSEDGDGTSLRNFGVNFYQTTRHYNLEDLTFREHIRICFNDALGFSLHNELKRICKEAVVA